MTHVRQQIREQAVTTATGLTTTGSNVFSNRLFQLMQDQIPYWNVMLGEEEIEIEGDCNDRIVNLEFHGGARAADGDVLADTIDTMIEELEAVVLESNFSMIKTLDLSDIETDYDITETDQAFGTCTVTYRARYFTAVGAPGTAL